MTINLIEKVKNLQAKALKKSQEKKVEAEIFGEVEPNVHDKADIFTHSMLNISAKNDIHSMEHPMFSIATKPDTRIRYYEHNGNSIEVVPSVKGIATIWDKDIWLYAISQLIAAKNLGAEVSRRVRIIVYDLLVSTNRPTGGDHYKRIRAAFERLSGTRIITDITTNGTRIKHGFGLIDEWRIIEKSRTDERMIAVEIVLPEWLYNSVLGGECLTIHKDYFLLRGGLERRLYELARKHCGHQPSWAISVELLHKKTGSSGSLKEFRRKIKRIVKGNGLPDYFVSIIKQIDQIVFYNRSPSGQKKRIKDIIDCKVI